MVSHESQREHFQALRSLAATMGKNIGEFINSGNVFHREQDTAGRGATLTITARGTIRASVHTPTPTGIETFWGWANMHDQPGLRRLIKRIAL